MKARRTAGFTLVELVITASILVMMIAVATPLFGPIIAQHRLTSALQRIAGDLRYAQSLAIREGNPHGIHVSGTQYRLERNAGAWAQVTAWYNLGSDYYGSSLQSVRDHGGVSRSYIAFNSRGAVDTVFTGTTSFPITVAVVTASGATGSVSVLRSGVVQIATP